MNTPPTPKRHKFSLPKDSGFPGGTFQPGVLDNDFSRAISDLVTLFSHLENEMIGVMAIFMGDVEKHSAQAVWNSMHSNAVKIEIMLSALAHVPENVHLSDRADRIIDDFKSLNALRNRYIHGM